MLRSDCALPCSAGHRIVHGFPPIARNSQVKGVYQLINRRDFLARSAAFYLSSQLTFGAADDSLVVNDIHSQLNRTRVDRILRPKNVKELRAAVLTAKSAKKPLSIAGGRHAMGGQQFGTDMILVDMTALEQIVSFDPQRGLVEVQAGAFWPGFTTAYLQRQQGASRQWGFAQRFPKKDRCQHRLGARLQQPR